MAALQGGPGSPQSSSPDPPLVSRDPELTERYEAYCRRQAHALLSLLPREAIRPLYAKAREWAAGAGVKREKDPLATLLRFVEDLLPLPPLTVWSVDRARNLAAHLEEEFASAPAQPRRSLPVTVESRSVQIGDSHWRASLNLFRRDDAWRGFIAFQPLDSGPGVRTADVFREEDPEAIKDRFRSFHPDTLRAFLRSVL